MVELIQNYESIEKTLQQLWFNCCDVTHRQLVEDGIHCHYQKQVGSHYICIDYYRHADKVVFKLAWWPIKVHSRDHLKSIIKMFI